MEIPWHYFGENFFVDYEPIKKSLNNLSKSSSTIRYMTYLVVVWLVFTIERRYPVENACPTFDVGELKV